MRIVSLLPSATEIVCALGAGEELVGRSAECDFPGSVSQLPVVMRVRSEDALSSSAEIDARVRSVRGRGESLYDLDLDALGRLRPDVILTQDLCTVCSVTDEEVRAACRELAISPSIVTLAPDRLDRVWASVERVGTAIRRDPEARALTARLRARSAPGPGSRSKVAIVEWLSPPILAGLWTPDIVESAGGVPVGVRAGEHGLRTTWEALSSLQPDLVLLSPCSFAVARTRRELTDPSTARGLARLHPPLGTWLADEAYFSRPGPRLADGIELVRALLNGMAPAAPMPVARWEALEAAA